jgi:hypothetical protein
MSYDVNRRLTATQLDKFHGSKVFEKAAFTIGLDDMISRRLLWEAVTTAMHDPWALTIDELGVLLPEVERRLRLIAPPDEASAAFARLRAFVLGWEEG